MVLEKLIPYMATFKQGGWLLPAEAPVAFMTLQRFKKA